MSFSHHGDSQNMEIANLMNRFADQVNSRAKRAWSEGRLNAEDQGDLAVAITTDHTKKRIIMDFGKPITWLAMTAEDAVKWGTELIRRAREISDKPLVLEI